MPELVDIRDDDGHLTGETMQRDAAHRSENRHGVALVWVYNSQGLILVQRRAAHLNTFPEKWDVSVAGHLTAGDQPLQTAARELGEELGIYCKADELEAAGELADDFPLVYGKVHKEYDFLYLTKQDVAAEELNLQAAEVSEARWISADRLQEELDDEIMSRHYSGRNRQVYQVVIDKVRQLGAAA